MQSIFFFSVLIILMVTGILPTIMFGLGVALLAVFSSACVALFSGHPLGVMIGIILIAALLYFLWIEWK